MFEDIDFESGIIEWDGCYDPNRSTEEQLLWLGEDLFQVSYDRKNLHYTIDVGWYPESSPKGSFRIVIVKNCNWNDFLYEKRTRDYEQLCKYMGECLDIVLKLLKLNE